MREKTRKHGRRIRHARVRKKVYGTPERPRMAISSSNRNIYVQFIDDQEGRTIASACAKGHESGHNLAAAAGLGTQAAAVASKAGIRSVVVDRGGHKFHGRVKTVVDAAVEAGLVISADKEK